MRSSKMLPIAILGASALVVLLLVLLRQTPEEKIRESEGPLVRVVVAAPTPHRFTVTTHGSVSPRTESDLIPQVSGEVVWVSPALAAGGFFEAGDPLARIDRADYRVDLEAARAAVARARSEQRPRHRPGHRDRQNRKSDPKHHCAIQPSLPGWNRARARFRQALCTAQRSSAAASRAKG